ncbi:hypothetical protein BDN71DRAFT_793091 [Pleurotus eryngii]|uniref:Uncharacterized protein n=1 Tax=Pleurotus eryngii TaxID=5323 RepID=A0A9P6CZV7_PLEER|nr:hypothetical protein BDN71DRAFT_793091 [Pleurotus eryngii]
MLLLGKENNHKRLLPNVESISRHRRRSAFMQTTIATTTTAMNATLRWTKAKITRVVLNSALSPAGLWRKLRRLELTTTNLVEGKESPKKDHHWNMYQSWYGEHGPTKKPTDMKVSEYTKSIVKPTYDEFLASKDDQTTLADYFEPIHKFYESAQAESNKQRQEDGNAGASVNLVTSKFQHLSQWAFLNHDVHAIGFVFLLSKDKGGSDLQNVFFGSPHMRELNNNMQSNIHQSLTDIRGELIVANTRLRRQALAPAPEAWLNQIDFSIKANGERERDRDRRVLPEILRQLANTLIESRDTNDQAPKKPLKTFLWTNWANVAFRYQFTMINCKDIAGMVRLWRNYKDNELNDEEADGLLRIVEWSPEEKDMDLKDQATIALVVDDSKRESLITVRDSPDYLKAMGKCSVAQAKETAGAERQSQKDRRGVSYRKGGDTLLPEIAMNTHGHVRYRHALCTSKSTPTTHLWLIPTNLVVQL